MGRKPSLSVGQCSHNPCLCFCRLGGMNLENLSLHFKNPWLHHSHEWWGGANSNLSPWALARIAFIKVSSTGYRSQACAVLRLQMCTEADGKDGKGSPSISSARCCPLLQHRSAGDVQGWNIICSSCLEPGLTQSQTRAPAAFLLVSASRPHQPTSHRLSHPSLAPVCPLDCISVHNHSCQPLRLFTIPAPACCCVRGGEVCMSCTCKPSAG